MRLYCLHPVFTFNIILASCFYSAIGIIDPFSIAAGVGSVLNYGKIKDQTYCRFTECCSEHYIPGDVNALHLKLQQSLFGQHIVIQEIVPALKAHFSSDIKSKKPLVISFHGTPGTGKNFVSDMIAQALYTNGLKSKYVHKYLGRADFPLASESESYKVRINREVREAIASCPRSLFIFDEVEQMPPGVFESMTSLVGYNELIDGNDYTKAIFILISNTAGVQISDQLVKMLGTGTLREDTKFSDFEHILEVAAYNLGGGLQKASLIEAHVIDHFLPFLPLERLHVAECVAAEFRRWGKYPEQDVILNLVRDVITYDRKHRLFATSGCKTLDKKVAVEVNR